MEEEEEEEEEEVLFLSGRSAPWTETLFTSGPRTALQCVSQDDEKTNKTKKEKEKQLFIKTGFSVVY